MNNFKVKSDIGANWSLFNPILANNELGHDATKNGIKVGDGVTRWLELPYMGAEYKDMAWLDWQVIKATNIIQDLSAQGWSYMGFNEPFEVRYGAAGTNFENSYYSAFNVIRLNHNFYGFKEFANAQGMMSEYKQFSWIYTGSSYPFLVDTINNITYLKGDWTGGINLFSKPI